MVDPSDDALSPAEEELLAMILGDERSGDDAELQAQLANDPELADRLEALKDVNALLAEDATREHEILREMDAEPPAVHPLGPGRTWPTVARWAAVAAAAGLLLAIWLGRGGEPAETPDTPWDPGSGTPLGSTELTSTSTEASIAGTATFEVVLDSARPLRNALLDVYVEGQHDPVFTLDTFEGPDERGVVRWRMTPSQVEALPAAFRWRVEMTDLAGVKILGDFPVDPDSPD